MFGKINHYVIWNCWNHRKMVTSTARTFNAPETTYQRKAIEKCINKLFASRFHMSIKNVLHSAGQDDVIQNEDDPSQFFAVSQNS